ncbi:MAG: HAMP domain-containing sensor histidine kinase [Planctomycetaceae bacterium]
MSPEMSLDERERFRAQYSEIASLAGGLAHEIKNPLSTISMNLELMAEEINPDESPRDRRLHQKIQTVQRECQHLEEILNAFLAFARAGEIDTVPTDLNDLITDFLEFYQPRADEYGLEVSPHLGTDLPPVDLDRSLFRQVLMNLVLNAHQAMPEGGLLELQTYQRDDRVFLDLIDNGVGMDEATRSKMFQAFFSTRSGGSGLGLPTVRKIIEAHRGEILCESEPGQGTRFIISLPASNQTS